MPLSALLLLQLFAAQPAQPASPVSADSGMFMLDTGVAYVHRRADHPDVAFDGTNFTVVWTDNLRDPARHCSDIYCARVSPSGVLVDRTGLVVAQGHVGVDPWSPRVADSDSCSLIIWCVDSTDKFVCGRRMSSSGDMLDTTGFLIGTFGPYYIPTPVVATGDSCWLVVWPGSAGVCGGRVGFDGRLLDTASLPIHNGTSPPSPLGVASSGNGFLVVWGETAHPDQADLYCARVSQSGSVLDTVPIALPRRTNRNTVSFLSVAYGAGLYAVTWDDTRNGYQAVWGARVTPQGVLLDSHAFAVSREGDNPARVDVAFDGSNFLAVWQDNSSSNWDIYAVRVSPTGRVIDRREVGLETGPLDAYTPAVACGQSQSLVVWGDDRYIGDDYYAHVYGRLVDTSGAVLDTSFPVAGIVPYYCGQSEPASAFLGSAFLCVWQSLAPGEDPDFNGDIIGMRVGATGTPLDTVALDVSNAYCEQTNPAVAAGDSTFLVAWEDGRWDWEITKMYGTIVSLSGVVLFPQGIEISNLPRANCTHPAVAFDGTDFTVFWAKGEYSGGDRVYRARVTEEGTVLDPGGVLLLTPGGQVSNTSALFDGTNYFVVWQRAYNGYDDDIWGARVRPDGTVLDPYGILIGSDTHMQECPAVAFDGTNYLVTWTSRYDWKVHGARVTQGGTVLDPTGILISWDGYYEYNWYPSVAYDGSNFIVAWQADYTADSTMHGAVVNPHGVVVDSFVLPGPPDVEVVPNLARGPGNQILMTWPFYSDSLGGQPKHVLRIMGTFFDFPAGIGGRGVGAGHAARFSAAATIIRNVLSLPPTSAVDREASRALLDVSGRKVLDLHSGANDVRALAPGVYFVRSEPTAVSRGPSAVSVRKVVVTR